MLCWFLYRVWAKRSEFPRFARRALSTWLRFAWHRDCLTCFVSKVILRRRENGSNFKSKTNERVLTKKTNVASGGNFLFCFLRLKRVSLLTEGMLDACVVKSAFENDFKQIWTLVACFRCFHVSYSFYAETYLLPSFRFLHLYVGRLPSVSGRYMCDK